MSRTPDEIFKELKHLRWDYLSSESAESYTQWKKEIGLRLEIRAKIRELQKELDAMLQNSTKQPNQRSQS